MRVAQNATYYAVIIYNNEGDELGMTSHMKIRLLVGLLTCMCVKMCLNYLTGSNTQCQETDTKVFRLQQEK